MGIGTTTPGYKLEISNGDVLNRGKLYQYTSLGQGSGAHGVSWYSPAYYTWYDYMAPPGTTNSPSATAAPSDSAANVTSWARRFNIENAAGYGWTFESGANASGSAPTVKFAISSNTGTFHATGNGLIDGNVGIGTTSPAEKLEVSGNIKLSGATPTYKITNLIAPTAAADAATKGYVDAASGGGSLITYGMAYTSSTPTAGQGAPACPTGYTLAYAGFYGAPAIIMNSTTAPYTAIGDGQCVGGPYGFAGSFEATTPNMYGGFMYGSYGDTSIPALKTINLATSYLVMTCNVCIK